MAAHLAARSHRWCRYWDGSVQKQLEPLVESGPMLVSPWLLHQAETSGRQNDGGLRPPPCRPHPSHHRPASRRCGSAKWFGQSFAGMLWRVAGHVNEVRMRLFQLLVLRLGLFQDGDVGIGVFPVSEEPLLRQVHPSQQGGVAWVGADATKDWIKHDPSELIVSHLISLLQP